jgi:hypothetical protein
VQEIGTVGSEKKIVKMKVISFPEASRRSGDRPPMEEIPRQLIASKKKES